MSDQYAKPDLLKKKNIKKFKIEASLENLTHFIKPGTLKGHDIFLKTIIKTPNPLNYQEYEL
jgi:hypothetical protein